MNQTIIHSSSHCSATQHETEWNVLDNNQRCLNTPETSPASHVLNTTHSFTLYILAMAAAFQKGKHMPKNDREIQREH